MSKRCMGCMELYGNEFEICPHCGYIEGTKAEEAIHMEPGTLLHDRYIIGKVLGFGGFGVTYIGWDGKLEQKVAIKEYLPSEFSTRMPGQSSVTIFNGEKNEQFHDGMKKFIEEAKRLAKFQNEPGIVKVFDSFSENETAYIIMEYLDGETLTDYLSREKTIPEDDAVKMLLPIMNSLQVVHSKGILHRDIAPDNIFLTKSGDIKLIDFGASRYATTTHSRSLTVIIKPGYSPEEQYRSRGDQGPYTDVYALAATLYKMITGKTPPDAMERRAKIENQKKDILIEPHNLNKKISVNRENAILNAMNVQIEDRTPDIQTFMDELNADPPAKRRYGKIKKIDLFAWPLWLKIALPSVLAVLLTLGILLITGVIRFPSLFSDEIIVPEGVVIVPDVEGMDKDAAAKAIEENHLHWLFANNVESPYITAGKIVIQSPVGGSYLDEFSTVQLTISRGSGAVDVVDGMATVPELSGASQEEAFIILKENGLAEPIVKTESNDNVPAGRVCRQSVKPDEKVKEGTQITIYISTGPTSFKMPNVIGMKLDIAKKTLEEQGLVVEETYAQNETVNEGDVISQSVNAGESVKKGTTVTLTVSSGKPIISVADVVGKATDEATAILEEQGFIVDPRENYDDNVASGTVIIQSPSAGTNQTKGATITLYISKGKQPVSPVPPVTTISVANVVGKTKATATSTLEGQGFKVTFIENYDATVASGTVISQSPSAGTSQAKGTTITLYISKGKPPATTVSVANVVGKTSDEAISILEEQGFIVNPQRKYDANVASGTVISQSPSAETKQAKGDTITIYISTGKQPVNVTFNANGGNVSTNSMTVYLTDTYGSLPTPTKDYYTFNGWYTSINGGTQITNSSVVSNSSSHTLYAHWTEKALSGWVLSNQVPSGAKVVEEKWTYDLTTYITSKNSYEPGYTQYDSTWEWGSYGEWSNWSKSSVNKSDSRDVETKTVTDKQAYTKYRYWIYRSSNHYWYGTKGWNGCNIYDEITLTSPLQLVDSKNELYGYYQSPNCSHKSCNLWFFGEATSVPAETHQEYRYRDRSKVYTYYHQKTESKESTTKVTSSDTISNVQTWVRYRAK